MSKNGSPAAPERLELAVARLLIATVSLRAPAVWCFAFAVALNALTLIVPSWNGMAWAAPVVGGCGLIWLVVAQAVIRPAMPTGLRARDVLAGLGFAAAARAETANISKLSWAVYIPLVLTLVPGWIGAVATAAFVLAAVMFAHRGQAGLTRAATIVVVAGCALIALSFAGTRAVSIACGVIALLGLIVLAVGTSSPGRLAKSLLRVESMSAAGAVLASLPLGVVGGLQSTTIATVIVGGVVVPAASLLAIYLWQKGAISRCRRSTANLRASLESGVDLLRCEDEVRESDGYWRVCEPRYSHAWPLAVGESGYIAWPEHDSVAFPIRDGEWCLSRAITSTTNPLLSGRDAIGVGVRRILEGLGFGVATMVGDSNLQAFVSRVTKPWHLRVFRGHDEREYLKMPWESGEVMAVPRNFTCSFVYPTGCGVVDRDGLPCEVRSVRVQLSLRQEVVADFDNAAPSQVADINKAGRPSCSLVWRAPLIIPAVYEGILRVLAAEMKNWRSLERVDQAALLAAIVARSQECLGKDLSALLSLQITSVDVIQSAVSEEDRDVHRKLSEFRQTMPGKKTAVVRRLEVLMRGRVYSHNQFVLKAKVDRAVGEIAKKLDEGMAEFDKALAGGMVSTSSDGSQTATIGEGVELARSMVLTDALELKKEVRVQRDRMIHALNEIDQAFRRTS